LIDSETEQKFSCLLHWIWTSLSSSK